MDFYFDGNLTESCDLANDIAVEIDLVLHFDKHIDRIAAKAYSHHHHTDLLYVAALRLDSKT